MQHLNKKPVATANASMDQADPAAKNQAESVHAQQATIDRNYEQESI